MIPMQFSMNNFQLYVPILIAVGIGIFFGLLTHFVVYILLVKHFKMQASLLGIFLHHLKNPLYVIFVLFYFTLAASALDLNSASQIISHIVKVLFILAMSWSALKIMDYLDIWLLKKSLTTNKDLRYTVLITKYHVLKNIGKLLIFILAISLLLLSFESVREIGKGILVSAGVAGAIVALSAQKLVSNIISGFQLAFTKPIKIGDTLGIEGEIGKVEEITSTNVTLCLWDLRRLVLPLNYFIDKPFIHFTQPDPNLLGSIPFHVDYSIDIQILRQFLIDTLHNSPFWDKKMGKLEVIDLKENSLQLRALISARNTGDLWSLGCEIREKIVNFVSENSPHSFPTLRTRINADAASNIRSKNIPTFANKE